MCELCKLEAGLKVTICRTCHVPLVVSYEHKPEFTEEEKKLIRAIFPDRKIRWQMRSIPEHAHCHIEG